MVLVPTLVPTLGAPPVLLVLAVRVPVPVRVWEPEQQPGLGLGPE